MKSVHDTLIELNNFTKSLDLDATITYRGELSHMIRCGRSQISLNVSESGSKFKFELQKGKKLVSGQIAATSEESDKIKAFVKKLADALPSMPEIDHLTPIKDLPFGDYKYDDRHESFENFDSSRMVQVFKKAHDRFAKHDVEISGSFSSGEYSYATINTKTKEPVSYIGQDYNVEVVLQLTKDNKKELRASAVGEKLSDFEENELLEKLERDLDIKKNTPRTDVVPAKYDIIFASPALAEMIAYMGYVGFKGETYEYQMGMFQKEKHKLGDKVFSDTVTIIDDPVTGDTLFNRRIGINGMQRDSFPLIEKGVLKNFFYSDKETCDQFGVEVNNDFGVASLKMETGDGPFNWTEMIKGVKNPTLYVSYIHYMNFVNAAKGEFTGTSRFGTYLIEDGKIKSHLFNVRINDSFHRIFNNIEWISSRYEHVDTSNSYGLRNASSITCPAFIKISGVPISATASGKN